MAQLNKMSFKQKVSSQIFHAHILNPLNLNLLANPLSGLKIPKYSRRFLEILLYRSIN